MPKAKRPSLSSVVRPNKIQLTLLLGTLALLGIWLVYRSNAVSEPRLVFIKPGNYPSPGRIYSASTSGKSISTVAPRQTGYGEVKWSPNRKQIAYTLDNQKGKAGIFTTDSLGKSRTQLTKDKTDSTVSWSNSGRLISFVRKYSEIWTVDVKTKKLTKVYDSASGDTINGKVWTRDDKKIIFGMLKSNNYEDIHSIGIDGKGLKALTGTHRELIGPVSPDGSKIAFYSSRNGYNAIYTMNVDGSSETRLTGDIGMVVSPVAAIHDLSPEWSPDGTKLVYMGNYANGEANALFVIGSRPPTVPKPIAITGSTYWGLYLWNLPEKIVYSCDDGSDWAEPRVCTVNPNLPFSDKVILRGVEVFDW